MTHNVLIRGGMFENKGAEAMIRCVQHGIIDRIPDAIGLLDQPRGDSWTSQELRTLRPRIGLPSSGRTRHILATLGHGMRVIPRRGRRALAVALTGVELDLDAVVDISGYGAGDPWVETFRGRVINALLTDLRILDGRDVPFIYLPQSWGPFEKRQSRWDADHKLRTALRLYARDEVSLEWLKTLPSYDESKVSLASDIAFTFKGDGGEVGKKLLTDIGIDVDGPPVIGIVPNMRVYERAPGEGPQNAYIARLIEVTRHFADVVGCQIALMPHEIKTRPSRSPDDRYLCDIVASEARGAGTVCSATGEYWAEELKAMIGETSLLVSSRFHSIVAAMSLRVPMVSIAWAHKYRELMSSVGLGEYVVEYERLTATSLTDLCDQAWNRRDELKALLDENVPAHETSAHAVIDETVELLQEHMT